MAYYKVAILVETANAYSRGCIRGISRYVVEHGPWDIYYEERGLDSPVPTWLKNWDGDGVIVRSMSQDTIRCAMKTQAKIVNMGIDMIPGVPSVFTDFFSDAKMIVKYFQERFYSHFAFVGIRGKYYSMVGLESLRSTLGECPISVLELEQKNLAQYRFGKNTLLDRWLLKLPKPCAITACYDLVALYVILACQRVGLLVPDEIAVLGRNNDDIQCNFSPVPVSSIEPNAEHSGYVAAELLHTMMQGATPPSDFVKIPSRYIVSRRSTNAFVINDSLVRQAFAIIHERFGDGLTTAEIAAELGVHRRTLERRFQAAMNRSLHDEIVRVRLHEAEVLLRNTSLPVERVAQKVGLANGSYLYRLYKANYGTTPRQLKNEE